MVPGIWPDDSKYICAFRTYFHPFVLFYVILLQYSSTTTTIYAKINLSFLRKPALSTAPVSLSSYSFTTPVVLTPATESRSLWSDDILFIVFLECLWYLERTSRNSTHRLYPLSGPAGSQTMTHLYYFHWAIVMQLFFLSLNLLL